MWSKRLSDIRPETVVVYGLFLLLMGYARVIWFPLPELEGVFLGKEYTFDSWVKYLLPVGWMLSAWFVNFLISEQFQLLKRYSYFGFLWGLAMIHFGDIHVFLGSLMVLFWFLIVTRIQRSKRSISDSLDIGLFTGLMTLVDVQYIAFLALAWLLLLTYGRIRWRAVFSSLWGAITILLLAAVYCWAVGSGARFTAYLSWSISDFELPSTNHWPWLLGMAFWWLLSLPNYIQALSFANIVKRQSLSALLFVQLGAVLMWLTGAWDAELLLMCVPFSTLVFISNDLQYRKKYWWRELVFWSLILLSPFPFG